MQTGRELKIFVSTLACDGSKSGIGQYVMHLMRAFVTVAPEFRFDVLVTEGEEPLFVPACARMSAIRIAPRSDSAVRNVLWQQFAIPRLVARGGYDVAFFPAANRRLPFYVPCASVGAYHDLAILHLPGKYDLFHTVYGLRVLPYFVRRLTEVITVSESSKRDIVDYIRVPEDRVTVIPLGADTRRFKPRAEGAPLAFDAARYGIRAPYVLYISRIEHPGKNHVRLIEAFDRLKRETGVPHQLVIAGSEWPGAEAVHAAAARSAFAKDIVFTGFVPDDSIPGLHAGADALVFPSLFEGFGIPLVEAMASGVPIACSNNSSLPEVAGDAAVLFDPYDADSICAAMRTVLLLHDVRERLVRSGFERVRRFWWNDAARSTAQVFHRAAESRK